MRVFCIAPLGVLSLVVAACFGPASVGPTVNLAECVATDAFAGKSVAQIAQDCGADVLSVLGALLASKDPTVTASSAYGEAVRTKRALERLDAGAP